MTPVGGHHPHHDRRSWAVLARLRGILGRFLDPPPPRRAGGGGHA